jgi:hypothetical protein
MSRVPADPRSGWSELLRIGGVALVAAGVLSVALLAIVVTVADGAPPRDAARVVDLLVRHSRVIQLMAVLYLVVDLCPVVALPAVYVALRPVNRTWPLLAGFLAGVGLLADVTGGLWVYALPALGAAYAAAGALQPAYVGTRDLLYQYIWGAETRPYVALLATAIVLYSRVMWQGGWDRRTAALGMALGLAGIPLALLGIVVIAIIFAAWFVPTGVSLLRLSRRI